MTEFETFLSRLTTGDLAASVILLAVIVALRFLADRLVRRNTRASSAERRRWLSATKNISLAAGAFGLVIIWSSALSTFVLSLTAFAVAFVIATKELLLCLSGTVVRTSIDNLDVGDWIEVGETCGEIKENGLLTTTLYVVDLKRGRYEHTGRRISFPNSIFLSHPVQQVPRLDFVLHRFFITLPKADGLKDKIAQAEFVLNDLARSFESEAKAVALKAQRRFDSDFMEDPKPSVTVSTSDIGHPRLEVEVFCPVDEAPALEQKVTLAVLGDGQTGSASS